MQIPPTPTPFPLPVGTPVVQIDTSQFGLWAFSDDAINWWNRAPDVATQVVQIAIIVLIIIGAVVLIRKAINSLVDENR